MWNFVVHLFVSVVNGRAGQDNITLTIILFAIWGNGDEISQLYYNEQQIKAIRR